MSSEITIVEASAFSVVERQNRNRRKGEMIKGPPESKTRARAKRGSPGTWENPYVLPENPRQGLAPEGAAGSREKQGKP
ncbi:MAG TPA: hypothetical protein DEP53_13650 [Bacteroidetes bacterium]|nr:hypothetical protein [Bacteroidota bacterium]